MTEFLQFAILGLGSAAIYTLIAQGAVLIYRGSGVVNFAQGAFALLGAIVFTELSSDGVPLALALIASVLAGALAGVLTQVLVMGRLKNAAALVRVIATLGILVSIQAAATLHYGDGLTSVDQFLPVDTWSLVDIPIQSDRIYLFAIAAAVTAALTIVQRVWLPAVATRAAAENELSVATMGWSPAALATGNWAAGGALAGLAGALVVPVTGLLVANVVALMVPALAAALLGRFNSFPLALLGATVIGVGQSLLLRYWDQPGATEAVPFLIVIAVLVVTGQGLPLRSHLTERLPTVTRGRIQTIPAAVALAVVALLMLFVFDATWLEAFTVSLAAACIILSVVVVTGFAGQISLAQYSIGGLGVFVAGKLVSDAGLPFWLAALAGLLAAIPIGVAFALPALRTRGVNLAVVTLGLALAVNAMIFNNVDYTGGVNGTVVGETSLFGLSIDSASHPDRYAVFALAVFAVCALLVANVRRSGAGRRLVAIRENERAAASLGVSVVGAKAYAFAVAAAVATAGAILIGFRGTSISFDQFGSTASLYAVAFAVIGGLGYITGSLVGSTLIVGGVGALLNGLLSGVDEYLTLVGGLIVILTVVLNPDGVVPDFAAQLRAVRERLFGGRSTEAEPPPAVLGSGNGTAEGASKVEPLALGVDGVTVRYGGVVAVDAASLEVAPGEIVGLIGPNGAGKTTMIDAITGFTKPASGSVRLGDQDVTRKSVSGRARSGLGRSWQSLELFEDVTVHENILVASDREAWWSGITATVRPGSQELTATASAAVREFELEEDLDRLPGELSYGQRRLVGVARTVAMRPSVLLLDEPAAGLSDTESQELGTLLKRLAASWGMAILLVEHDMDLVMSICDRVVVLDFGKVIATGTPDQVRNDPKVLASYLGEPKAAEADQAQADPTGANA